jgi:hypothetical protein
VHGGNIGFPLVLGASCAISAYCLVSTRGMVRDLRTSHGARLLAGAATLMAWHRRSAAVSAIIRGVGWRSSFARSPCSR